LDLEGLRTFLAVVETEGVSAAARRLGVARSVVSKRIADLEADLGGSLFIRSTTKMTPTDRAREFYARAGVVLQELEDAANEAREDGAGLAGALRIAAPVSFTLSALKTPLLDFAAAHPALRVAVDLDDRTADLAAGGFDVAVRVGRLSDSALKARRLAASVMLVCAAPEFLARHGTPDRVADLAALPTIGYANLPALHVWRFEKTAVRVAPRLVTNNGETNIAAAIAGLGVLLTPAFIAADALADGRLVALDLDERAPPADVHAVFPAGREKTRKVRAFVDHLAERFAAPAPWTA